VDVKLLSWVQQVWRRLDFAVDPEGVVRVHPDPTRVVLAASQLSEQLIDAEIDNDHWEWRVDLADRTQRDAPPQATGVHTPSEEV
jgi:hypothetical protein